MEGGESAVVEGELRGGREESGEEEDVKDGGKVHDCGR